MTVDFRADLHCHSLFSDGTDSPEQLLQLAVDKGLSGLSITDHDTIAAYDHLANVQKIRLLSGIEFSAMYGPEPVHILGYAFDLKSEAMRALCERHKKRRDERNQKILDKLRRLGIDIKAEELVHKGLKGTIGRPHIAVALFKRGLVSSIQEAFERFLGEGKAAFDPGQPISVEETIRTIHQGKGKAILAHPHLLKRSTTIRAMLKMPFDGLEGYYARFTLPQQKKWLDLATQKKWLITGGSDYHGTTKPSSILGSSWTPQETFEHLYNHFLSVN